MSTNETQCYSDQYLKAAHKHTIYHRSEIDCVLGDASGYQVAEPGFVQAMSTYWFDGYSRMDANMPIEKVEWTNIEVD